MERVSVIVATYRRDAALVAALRSLGEQTYENLEILLVDDNADPIWSEKVAAAVAAFREQYPRSELRLIVNDPNLGSAKTRNVGIFAAEGEYITFLDDDDVYLPEKVARQLAHMKEVASDFSITDLELFNEQDKLIDRRSRDYLVGVAPDALLSLHLKHHMTGTDTMMFRREYLLAIGGFEPIDVGDEFYLMQKAIEAGGRFSYLPACDIRSQLALSGTQLQKLLGHALGRACHGRNNSFAQLVSRGVDKLIGKLLVNSGVNTCCPSCGGRC